MTHPAPNRFAPKQRTIADITLDLDMWLVNARDSAFDATRLEELQRRYSRLNPRVVEAKFNAAVMRRKGGSAVSRSIDAIYAAIPKVRGCKPQCSDCCGPVPMSETEAGRIVSVLRPDNLASGMVTPTKPGCLDCAYSTSAGCSIYESRPFMCRLFGAVADEPRLRCPHGAAAKRPLSAVQARTLLSEYLQASR